MVVQIEALMAPAQEVDRFLMATLEQRDLPESLRSAVRYVFEGGGKRTRPLLCLYGCQAVGAAREQAMVPAAAIELVHAFSLVHDDLPAMDDDDLRRGRPTLHRHANEAMAILAGDSMLALAFEWITERVADPVLSRSLCSELARATGDMIAGQVLDTLPESDPSDSPSSGGQSGTREALERIHRLKTGALIRCAARMGALCGGASPDQLDSISRYAEALGLMFQVVDDVLDVTRSTEELGKTAGKDPEQGKLTYPSLIGLEGSRQEVERLLEVSNQALAGLDEGAQPLRDLCGWLAYRTR